MITPFDESGALMLDSAGELAVRLVEQGTDALLVNGTTGESPTLDRSERIALFHEVLCATERKVPVIANVGDNCTHDSVAFARKVESLGVHAMMVVTPYYNKPPQEGLYRHFRAVAQAVDVPVILYNIPTRCVVNVDAATILRLAHDVENIVALKQATDDLEQLRAIIADMPDDFEVFSGDDAFTLPLMREGGTGVVSILSHLCGPQVREMVTAFAAGDIETAERLEKVLMPLAHALFETTNPILVKKGLELIGFPAGNLRLPLVEATDEQTARLKAQMDETFAQLDAVGRK